VDVEKISVGDKEIVLVGTAHISAKSIALVKETILQEQPDLVGVELDRQRYHSLVHEKDWRETNISKIVRSGQSYLFLANLLLAGFQKRIGRAVGTKPGSEMIEAIIIARENKIPVALLDRDVTITLRRAFALTSTWEKIKIGSGIIGSLFVPAEKIDEEKIESLKEQDTLNAVMQELAREMPSAKKVLVDERDIFIANNILRQKGKKIVAVVGIGHVQGIKKYLDKQRDVSSLLSVPKKKKWTRYVKFAIPLLFFGLIVFAFSSKGADVSINAIIGWVLVNGILSGLGVLLARGHPLSALAAFVAAPLTSLHPFLASGWVAGAVEAKIRVPKVKDFDHLQTIEKYSDLPKNAVTRILLVVAFANIGSSIGTVIGISYIASLLA
jgi:pheromone shutdown-related protein TraB